MQALPKPILHNEYRLEIAEAALERRPSRSSTSIEHVNATTRSHGTPAASVQGSIGRIAFLPRAIDKVRATLPGGAPGVYITTHDRPEIATMSGLFYRTLRITSNEFTAAVASADDENAGSCMAAQPRRRRTNRKMERPTLHYSLSRCAAGRILASAFLLSGGRHAFSRDAHD